VKIRVHRKVRTALVVVSLVVATVVWANTPAQSIQTAVSAGNQHTKDVVRAAPDGKVENAAADNFIQVKDQMRADYCAASQADDTDAPGGFAKSDSFARKVRAASQGKGLFLLAQPNVLSQFADKPGMRLVLVNQTSNLVAFAAIDSRLNIIQEAQDESGSWRALESLPSSWCGNSYHRVCLAPNYFWEFAAPRYQGPFKTKLRFRMTLADGSQIYSNVFDGSVSPEQFTIQ